jgi:hypothetical protein
MTRYFDAHLYFANWGSSAFMLRLPLSALDKTILAEFVQPTLSDAGSGFENALELITTAEHRVLAWRFNDDSGYCDRFCDEEGAEWAGWRECVPVSWGMRMLSHPCLPD